MSRAPHAHAHALRAAARGCALAALALLGLAARPAAAGPLAQAFAQGAPPAALAAASPAELRAAAQGPDLEERAIARALLVWQADPIAAAEAFARPTVQSRKGTALLPVSTDEAAGPVYLLRALAPGRAADERAAALAAAAKAEPAWVELAPLLLDEPDAQLRRLVADLLVGSAPAAAEAPLRRAAADPEAEVRAAALRSISGHPAGARWPGLIEDGLHDVNPMVRAEAARAAGYHGLAALSPLLQALLADPEPTVRLDAVRALRRVDPQALADRRAALSADPDARVRQAALAP